MTARQAETIERLMLSRNLGGPILHKGVIDWTPTHSKFPWRKLVRLYLETERLRWVFEIGPRVGISFVSEKRP